MMISVIVPIYNTERYLADCLDSIVRQTYKDLEIILIDDGSPDNVEAIYSDYAKDDSRIKVIKQVNQGLSGARNTGLKNATGKFIMFVDSDDWIEIDTCEVALGTLLANNADVVMWSYMREYPEKSKITYLFADEEITWKQNEMRSLHRRMVGPLDDELSEPQKIDAMVTAWGKLYKRSVIADYEFVDTKIIGTEDALFNIQVFGNVDCAVYLPAPMSHYRKDNITSLSHQYKSKLVEQWRELYRRVAVYINDCRLDEGFMRALNNRICMGLIGLGLNLAEDSKMTFSEKHREMKRILNMPHYSGALEELKFKYLPKQWEVFFVLCQRKNTVQLMGLLYLMNYLRGK